MHVDLEVAPTDAVSATGKLTSCSAKLLAGSAHYLTSLLLVGACKHPTP